jgi:hypothetical protein
MLLELDEEQSQMHALAEVMVIVHPRINFWGYEYL